MQDIDALKVAALGIAPHITFDLDAPDRPGGAWFLTVRVNERAIYVEWRPTRGFGISAHGHPVYGEGHDEIFSTIEAAKVRLVAVIREKIGVGQN